jgi:thiamine biosynthesis lipoprotein ApbE
MANQGMNRRSFLKLPALLPLAAYGRELRNEEYRFQYEGVLGTSLDLAVCTPDFNTAEQVCGTILEEIDRLGSVLDTRDPQSEIMLLENSDGSRKPSTELAEVLDAYNYWERRTGGVFSIHPGGPDTPKNVDALGKAYIINRAVKAARRGFPSIDAILLNIGGDIVVQGRPCAIAIADPASPYDNAEPLTTISLQNAAVATSGSYARGAHLIDGRDGHASKTAVAATVVARDAVTANALATTLCLTDTDYGMRLVEATPGAEAFRVASGLVARTSRFALLERPKAVQTPTQTPRKWPPGYQMTITLPLSSGRSSKRPYVAVWVEDSTGKLVRVMALWGTISKYHTDLSTLWNLVHGQTGQFRSVTRATRPAGKYQLVWDGLDNDGNPVPQGAYRITVETNQEHGTYARQTGTIIVGESTASTTLPATTNFDQVLIEFGPK